MQESNRPMKRDKGDQGFAGWTPVLSIVPRGVTEEVLQVINWTNPNPLATNKPTFPLYVGATGLTANIADAINIKGSQGLRGLQGIQGANGTNGTNGWYYKNLFCSRDE